MKPTNLWEMNALRKLTTRDLVELEIRRSRVGRDFSPSEHKRQEWLRKLSFLEKLKWELPEDVDRAQSLRAARGHTLRTEDSPRS